MAEILLAAGAAYLGYKAVRKAHSAYGNAKQEMYDEIEWNNYYNQPDYYSQQYQDPSGYSGRQRSSNGYYGGYAYPPSSSRRSGYPYPSGSSRRSGHAYPPGNSYGIGRSYGSRY